MDKQRKVRSPQILANNLRRLMDESVTLHTQEQVAKASGVAQTSVSLMLRPNARSQTISGKTASPKLAEVESVAWAFGMEVWQLLIDPSTLSETLMRALSSPSMPILSAHPPSPHSVTPKTNRPLFTRPGQ